MPKVLGVKEIERRAAEFLEQHASPITIPIDVDYLVESVEGVDLDYWPGLRRRHGLEGMVAKDLDTGGLFIYIDDHLADHEPMRYRMTVAEELGHVLLHRSCIDPITGPEDFKKLHRDPLWPQIERNAKRFAAAVLMPSEQLIQCTEEYYPRFVKVAGFSNTLAVMRQATALLSKQFSVSPASMSYRLNEWPMQISQRITKSMNERSSVLLQSPA